MGSDCRFDAIQFFGGFVKQFLTRSLFVNQIFETIEDQSIFEAFA